MKSETYVVLDNIRSAHNVGAIFRTCDAAGVARVFFCGFTPTPVDRFGRARKDIAKVALGAEQTIPWEYHEYTLACIETLQSAGVSIVAVEQSLEATDFRKYTPQPQQAFVFGNEVTGVDERVLQASDMHIHIPMHGSKESLNVSVSVGIILFATKGNVSG